MRVFAILYDPTQTVCPVEADDAEHARRIIAESLNADVSKYRVYDTAIDADMQAIVDFMSLCVADEPKEQS